MQTKQWTVNVSASTAEILEGVAEAAAMLSSGDVVAFPTETVYGLGANALSDDAVRKIYKAKGRCVTEIRDTLLIICVLVPGTIRLSFM